jgi:hypothetical protein
VLDVLLAEVLLGGLLELFGIECELIELNYGLLVGARCRSGWIDLFVGLSGGMRGDAARGR